MRLGAALLWFSALCLAQQPLEIHGVVTEPGVGPVAGVEIKISRQDNQGTSPSFTTIPIATVFTDARGEFLTRVPVEGTYSAYTVPGAYVVTRFSSTIVGARVDASHPRAEFGFAMQRLGQLMGRVVDADTLEPLPGIPVAAMQKSRVPRIELGIVGEPKSWQPSLPVRAEKLSSEETLRLDSTAANGDFTLTNRVPGNYAVTVVTPSETSPAPTFTIGYAPGDLDVIDRVYPPLYWPGGVPAQDAVPLALTSGGVLNIGTIAIRKAPSYRAHVSLTQGECPEGESVRLTLFSRADNRTEVVPCGTELLVKGLQPGPYVLYVVSDWQGERENVDSAVWATAHLTVEDKNLELMLTPRRGIVLEGRVTSSEGGPALPEFYSLASQPDALSPGMSAPPGEQFIEFKQDGRFRMAVGPHSQTLIPDPRNRSLFLKEARYNGTPATDLKLPLNLGSPSHNLELLLDDKFATVRGEVTGSGAAMVVLQREGALLGQYSSPVNNGAYVSPPLPPGRYRIAAVPSEQMLLEQTLELLQDAPIVTVKPGATETFHVRFSNAR